MNFDDLVFPRDGIDLHRMVRHLEWHMIWKAAFVARGNRSKMARLLNISRATLYNKFEEHKIKLPKDKGFYIAKELCEWEMGSR